MATTNDDRRRPSTSKSKMAKSEKGQKTLFDMFGKGLESTTSQRTFSQSSLPFLSGCEEGDPPSEVTIMPDSTDTIESNNTPVTTSRRKPTEIPTSEDQTSVGLGLADTAFIDLSDSEFDSGPESLPITVLSEEESQGSRDAPIIVIDSSPMKRIEGRIDGECQADPIPALEVKKPLHPFFAPRGKIIKSAAITSPRRHRPKDPEAVYPDRESQHVKGSQTAYSSPACPFERRYANTNPVSPERSSAGYSLRTEEWVEKDTPVLKFLFSYRLEEDRDPYDGVNISPTTEQEIHSEPINPNLIREHPAIERVVDTVKIRGGPCSSSGQLWTDVWRPRCAKEVLGNEHSALYLRNWLYTLGIQLNPPGTEKGNGKKKRKKTKKRPRVVREVARKKPRRDGLDGFLVEDDEEDDVGPPTYEEEEDELMNRQGGSRHSGRDETTSSAFASDEPETINERLHNTILLTGPSGTGKSAAVFACAEELGWEVFEVYPGIGRRNGANVDNLVGEVGKNHLVRKKKGATRQASIATLLSKNAGTGDETEDWASSGEASAEEGEQGIKQSVILLEEVDVLFKDDVNFWPAVTNLIKECRRPVICTCNDASLVPKDELPLQKVLYFEPCGPEIGAAYLQGLAYAEGYKVPRETLWGVYCETYELVGADKPQDTSAPTAHCELPVYDLRRAIHRVQMGCTTGGRWEAKNSTDTECQDGSRDTAWEIISHEGANDRCRDMREMDGISQQGDLMSIIDIWTGRGEHGGEEASGYGWKEDDENGHTILYGGDCEIGVLRDRDEEIAQGAIRLARGQVAPGMLCIDGDDDGRLVFRRRQVYEEVVARGLLGRRPRLKHEWTEEMGLLRDMGRRRLSEVESGNGRRTRNSKRQGGLEAVLSVGKELLAAACSGMEWQRGVAGL